jgi:hypothetical protein
MKDHPYRAISVIMAIAFCVFAGTAIFAGAQDQQSQPVPQQVWTADQLDNLVAPIALYPDPLLSQILVASTYPLEVVEASQWLHRNQNLRGQTLIDAAKQQAWDPSIQALVAVPDALDKLNQDVRWTADLGNAFLSQEADVMSAVQRMRDRAQAKGRLYSTPQQTVTTQDQSNQRVIVIQPVNPDVIYVPVYDPLYVWGSPVYGYYPRLYYPTFGFSFGTGFNISFCYAGWSGWGYWGWGPNWHSRTVFVNNNFFHNYGYRGRWSGDYRERTVWVHDPDHRMHVPYRTDREASRFGGRNEMRDSRWTRSGQRDTVAVNSRYSDNRFAGSSVTQRYQSRQDQRSQNYSRQQDRSYSYQNRSTPSIQRSQSQESSRYQVRQPSYSAPQSFRSNTRTFNASSERQIQSSSQSRFSGASSRFSSGSSSSRRNNDRHR